MNFRKSTATTLFVLFNPASGKYFRKTDFPSVFLSEAATFADENAANLSKKVNALDSTWHPWEVSLAAYQETQNGW
jgi:hypothetical protein